jgi:hypothetical protein
MGTHSSESKLCGDQRLPLVRLMNDHQLRCDSCNELSKPETELVGTDHEATNLERSDLRDVCDQDGLSKTDAQANEDCCTEPALPTESSDLGDRPSKKDDDGTDHGFPVMDWSASIPHPAAYV